MLSNISKLFKKGASSPSSKDRPNPFSEGSDNLSPTGRGSSRGTQQRLRGRSGKHSYSNGDIRPYSLDDDSSSNGHCTNGHLPASPLAMGFDDAFLVVDRSGTGSPAHPFVNGKPVTDPKVLQILGAEDVDQNGIAEWMVPPKEDVSSEFSPTRDESETEGSSPDMTGVTFPQKSELPPSFEFARPTGQTLNKDIDFGEGMHYPDTGASTSPSRPELDLPHAFPFGQANRSYGEESSLENGTATGSEEDNSVDSVDAHPLSISRPPPPSGQTFRPSSPRPLIECSSPSPRATRSPEGRSWGSNHARQEGVSWGSNGSVSPRWVYSGQPSPERGSRILHPLPAPPPSSSPHSPVYGRGSGWTEAPHPVASRDRQGPPLAYKVQSPSRHRPPPRLSSHLSPLMSPFPSPPRSPIASPRPSIPPGSWSPLPAPPLQCHSPYQSPPRSPSRIPRTLTKWKKIKQIGVGSFGTVHEAINLDDGSFFAVKVSHEESIPAEIQKEIEVLSMLRHPNVVQYYGTAMEDGHLCIFLELMQNSLQSIIKVFNHFDETLISTYTRQILHGLEYLHRKNTIHRDIKCANILVDKDGQVKLADFGLAKEVGISLATSCKGTPYFMAPEILKPNSINKRGYGLPVDIWSLGCTVIEMADGKPPWSFLQGFSFFFKLNKGELPPIPQHLSDYCKDFIKQCLQFRPEDRPTASQLLHHPFVANAPATSAVAAFMSPSAAAIYMRNTLVEGPHGRNGGHKSRDGVFTSDQQGPDSPHQRHDLQQQRADAQHYKSRNGVFMSDQQGPESPHHRHDLQQQRPDSQHLKSRNGVFTSDQQGPDSPHHRYDLQQQRPDSQHHKSRNGVFTLDQQGPDSPRHRHDLQQQRPDSQHHRPDCQHYRSDLQHHRPDSQHHRPTLQRSHRLDRSLNKAPSNRFSGTYELPEAPRSPSSDAASNYGREFHGW